MTSRAVSSVAVTHLSDSDSGHAEEIQKLSALLEASQALLTARSLKTGLQQVLEVLDSHSDAVRSMVFLLSQDSDELSLAASAGAIDPARRIVYRADEGITGQVLQSGKPIVVPQVSREPTFLRRVSPRPELAREELTHIAVPIALGRQTVGTLSIDLRYTPHCDYQRLVKFLGVAASIIAHAVKIHRLVEADRQKLLAENSHLRQELKQRYDFSNIIGTSGPIRRVYEQVEQVAQTGTTVMLRGESGTGKELIANAIHYNSPRGKQPLVKVNLSALPQDLIESELFGYEKGAFTGAHAAKKGRFELAEGGTLLLDEIGELNPATQVKLLRVLQEREFERLGGVATIRANLRLIVATHRDLEQSIAGGGFREDLYYRLNVFTIFIPPLRERRPDILLLADYFLEKFAQEHRKTVRRISTPAIDMLMAYHWPGNVRELENAIERAVVVCDGQVIHAHHLPPTLQTAEASGTAIAVRLTDAMAAYEKDMLQDALKSARGNRAKAARVLGVTARIFNYKVRTHGIDWRRFRPGS